MRSASHTVELWRPPEYWAPSRITCLQQITQVLNGAVSLDAIGSSSLPILCESTNAVRAALWMLDGDSQAFELIGSFGISPDAPRSVGRLSIESIPMLREALRTREPVVVESKAKWERSHGEFAATLKLDAQGSSIALPLLVQDRVLGGLTVELSSWRALAADEREFMMVVAAQCAQALERAKAHQALEQAVRARDEVLSVVAHDLGNPLSVVSMAASRLQKNISDPATLKALERILRATQRAEHLVRDLLEVHAIEGGRFKSEKRRIETARTILSAVESQQSLTAGSSVILATDISPDLPSIDCDEERMLEVLENLIGNAVKFTSAGGSVTVGANRQEGDVLVWVKDTGEGIAPEDLPHLFDRFWQATKSDRRGTGLGLTICKAIVEAHGGKLWAESTLGKGTTLYFTLPVEQEGAKQAAPAAANILLVDDRAENLLSLKAILERPDYRLVAARSGQEALGYALREKFTVAIIDVAMPGMNGLEVATHLQELERSRDIPIIFVTAFGDDPEEIHRAYAAGGADYLVKPLDPEIVRKKVAVFVGLSRSSADRRNNEEP